MPLRKDPSATADDTDKSGADKRGDMIDELERDFGMLREKVADVRSFL
jgi:hypothetical protein